MLTISHSAQSECVCVCMRVRVCVCVRACGKASKRRQRVNNEGVSVCVRMCVMFSGSPRDLGLTLIKNSQMNGTVSKRQRSDESVYI